MKKTLLIAAIIIPVISSCTEKIAKDVIKGDATVEEATAYIEKQTSAIPEKDQTCEFDKYAVDLGLSVYWSAIDLGAESVGKLGKFFLWGDIQTFDEQVKKQDAWIFWDSANKTTNSKYDEIDGLSGEYDQAVTLIGNGWRLPTQQEAYELRNASIEVVTYNGQIGRVVWTTKGVLFFPGYGGNSKENYYGWTSDKSSNPTYNGTQMYVLSGSMGAGNTYGYLSALVRPVMDKVAQK